MTGLLVLGEANAEPARRPAVKTAEGQCGSWRGHGKFMDCGEGVRMCGALVLQTGDAEGTYHHDEPVVHGLWPQLKPFGSSQCEPPRSRTGPPAGKIFSCYSKTGGGKDHVLWFQTHEWTKHGACAGSQDAEDFFGQVCNLTTAPLSVMGAARAAGMDLGRTADQLQSSGHCVWSTSSGEGQIMLSACASADGRWKLAAVADFPSVCASGPSPGLTLAPASTPASTPAPVPQPKRGAGKCGLARRGPACTQDADCANLVGCVRCARSGFCTGMSATVAFV